MAFETHGFFTGGPKKILEDCGHIVLGHCPLDLLWYAREWTTHTFASCCRLSTR